MIFPTCLCRTRCFTVICYISYIFLEYIMINKKTSKQNDTRVLQMIHSNSQTPGIEMIVLVKQKLKSHVVSSVHPILNCLHCCVCLILVIKKVTVSIIL